MTHFGKLFASRNIVSGNRGLITNNDYIMAARASDGSVIMAYMPVGRAVTVDMAKVAGSAANVWWYDPGKGNTIYQGEFPTSGLQDFASPDQSDWVLVIDNANLGFPPPGGAGTVVLAAQCAHGKDNDGDGLTDYPANPGCSAVSDNNEINSTSQDSTIKSNGGSTEPYTLLFLLCAFVALRRDSGEI